MQSFNNLFSINEIYGNIGEIILSEEYCIPNKKILKGEIMEKKFTRKLNPRPHALKSRIIPLNQQAHTTVHRKNNK